MSVETRHGSFQFPTATGSIVPSTQDEMDAAISTLQQQKQAWVQVATSERISIVDALIRDFAAIAPRWVAAGIQAKGIDPASPTVGEEWATGVWPVVKQLRQLRQALVDIAANGQPRIPGPVTARPDGQVVAQVFPQSTYDKLFFGGVTAEIWMEPGVTKETLASTQATLYRDKNHAGKLALVLGAGNVASIGPLDIIYKLFMEDQVVLYKTNPVNAYLGPLIQECFRALIEPGYLRIVYGGATEGAYLCNHNSIEEIHITGSDKTFDAIVFGTGPEGAKRKAERTPQLHKRITGELGNVSPVIVVPGPWSQSDLAYQATHIVSMLTNNAGFNCNATRVVIQHAGWSQRGELLREVRNTLARVPLRNAYYPGAHERQKAFVAAHPDAEEFGTPEGRELAWTFITDVDAQQAEDICFTTEAFCGLFGETALEASSVAEYIERAVEFANEGVWGTLNATILVHPESLKDPQVAQAIERAVANLRYGSIGVNYWAGISFGLGTTTWGAFPGHPLHDIQSGTGVVHNSLMFTHPQKSVLRAPFRSTPTPTWFVSEYGKAVKVFPKLVQFEASPSPLKVPGIIKAAMFG
ncbi:MAG TPA: aldehyde dehydrogenase family protein [Ktedonobacteraceae bacterium]|nr:aldehyde dehydrogenase family protein [Ktedonobacteraceae bacterium]